MELLPRIESRLREAGLWRDSLTTTEAAWMAGVLELLKPRVKKLDQLVDELRPFLVDEPEIDPAAAAKHLRRKCVRCWSSSRCAPTRKRNSWSRANLASNARSRS